MTTGRTRQHHCMGTVKLGLKISKKKTRTMRANQVNKNSIQLRGEDIEGVEQFTYLGSFVSRDGGTDRDTKSTIGKATAAFKTPRPIWISQVISVKTKLLIFNANVKSVVFYACETWRITKALTHKVQMLEGHPSHQMAGQNLKRRNLEKNRTSTSRSPDQEKWDWLGHTLRKPTSSMVRHTPKWNPQGKRKRGRPYSTWRRSVETEGTSKESACCRFVHCTAPMLSRSLLM